jgi:hypothetical protein
LQFRHYQLSSFHLIKSFPLLFLGKFKVWITKNCKQMRNKKHAGNKIPIQVGRNVIRELYQK